MKLDRNANKWGRGKYALIKLRTDEIEFGAIGAPTEFFVIKLRDRYSKAALLAYADAIKDHDPEFASDVLELARRAGEDNPYCKDPD